MSFQYLCNLKKKKKEKMHEFIKIELYEVIGSALI